MVVLISKFIDHLSTVFQFLLIAVFCNYFIFILVLSPNRKLEDPDYDNRISLINDIRLYYHENFCECKIDDIISLESPKSSIFQDHLSVYIFNKTIGQKSILYTIGSDELSRLSFTCDVYKSLRRGRGQKVISLAYSQSSLNEIRVLSKSVKALYPDWIIRVYHNGSVNSNDICSIECMSDSLDFCDLTRLGTKNLSGQRVNRGLEPTLWRFLPIGDEIVDVFLAGDIDGGFIQDNWNYSSWEDSGQELENLKGFFNRRDRRLAHSLFQRLITI